MTPNTANYDLNSEFREIMGSYLK